MKRNLAKYGSLLLAAWRAELQYRGNIGMNMLGGLCYQGVGLAFIWVILDQFGDLGGWGLSEIAFLYGIRLAAHGAWIVVGQQLIFVDEVVRGGEYDRYLVRPLSPLLQLLSRRFRPIALGDLLGGVVLLCLSGAAAPVDWSIGTLSFLMAAVLGGAMIEGAAQLFASALAFRLVQTMPFKMVIDVLFNDFGNYPLVIFDPATRFFLTFVLPMAFVAYLPASVLLERTDELAVPQALAWGAPLVAATLLFLARTFWNRQARSFQSSGH